MTEGKDAKGMFTPGNRFWEVRSSHGRKPTFDGPEKLESACLEYFTWSHDNPLYADQLVTFQGSATHEPVAKMRAMTLAGLCMFLDIAKETWRAWRESRPDLSEVMDWAEAVIYRQKFEGAAAELLNPSIIARDLGLVDRQGVDHSGTMKAQVTSDAAFAQLASLLGSAVPGAPSGDSGPGGVA